jgi:hypothetical protein
MLVKADSPSPRVEAGFAGFVANYIASMRQWDSLTGGAGNRGFWERLGEQTGIAAQRWRSVIAGRQQPTFEMVDALLVHSAGFAKALEEYLASLDRPAGPEIDTAALICARLMEIKRSAKHGVWARLEQTTGVAAQQWRNVVSGRQSPTFAMFNSLLQHDQLFAEQVATAIARNRR